MSEMWFWASSTDLFHRVDSPARKLDEYIYIVSSHILQCLLTFHIWGALWLEFISTVISVGFEMQWLRKGDIYEWDDMCNAWYK